MGASALGLVSEMPSGPGVIPEDSIAAIAASVPQGIDTFLLTSLTGHAEVAAQHARCRTTTIQLCDLLPLADYPALRASLPDVSLVQALHVTGPETVEQAAALEPHVDAILLDSGSPTGPVRELGGTGRTHDWEVSARIVRTTRRPVWLAGGLNAANVGEAVTRVDPFGVDLCTGVRTNGALDAERLGAFMRALGDGGNRSSST